MGVGSWNYLQQSTLLRSTAVNIARIYTMGKRYRGQSSQMNRRIKIERVSKSHSKGETERITRTCKALKRMRTTREKTAVMVQ